MELMFWNKKPETKVIKLVNNPGKCECGQTQMVLNVQYTLDGSGQTPIYNYSTQCYDCFIAPEKRQRAEKAVDDAWEKRNQ